MAREQRSSQLGFVLGICFEKKLGRFSTTQRLKELFLSAAKDMSVCFIS